MNSVEAEGRTIEEAVASALAQLQVERERVEIEILSQATKGFLGIGGKKRACVRRYECLFLSKLWIIKHP
jgi:spoIIIJ-associated protein